jgi:acyl dehydratase
MSKHSGLSVRNVTRIIRHAIINHRFFEEPRPGIIVHSALTALLARDNLVRTSLQTTLGEFWPAGVRAADAMVRWPNSEEPNETVRTFSIEKGEPNFY